MLQTIKILSLVLFTTSLYSQWEVKNLDVDIFNTINKLKFYNDSIGYAMGTRGLILRTEDTGESWQAIETDIEGDISDFDYSNSGDIILTTIREKGTYKSTNGFDFFEIFPSSWESSNIEYSKSNKFYLSGEETIYRSTNDGQDWEAIYDLTDNGFQWAYITDFSFVNNQLGFAVGFGHFNVGNIKYNFLLKSIDSGENWEIISQIEDFDRLRNVYFIDELTGYLLSEQKTLKTLDGGLNWETLANMNGAVDLASPTTEKLITVNRPLGYNGAANSTVFIISESDDAGSTWTGDYRDGAHLETIQFINDSVGFVAGDYSLILKTENCGGELGEDYPWYLFTNATEDKNEQNIKIFPNPALDFLKLDFTIKDYSVMDIYGQVHLSGLKINVDDRLDITTLSSGTYILMGSIGENQQVMQRFVKL